MTSEITNGGWGRVQNLAEFSDSIKLIDSPQTFGKSIKVAFNVNLSGKLLGKFSEY